jgi:diacylglycerol kinase (ATP)
MPVPSALAGPLVDWPSMHRPKLSGWHRFLHSFSASYRGIRGAFRNEAAFRQELLVAVPVVLGGLWLGKTGVERALLIGPMILILVVEMLNSAIEATVDRIGLERHELSGLAKDLGSAAVMFSFGLLGLTWLLVLFF